MASPLVSVVIPVLNAGPYLDACLRSVAEQSHADLQVICVDDGSEDAGPEVLSAASRRDGRFQVIRTSARGPGGARNAGVDLAEGEYLMFVDADDLLAPQAVTQLLASLEASGSDFACGRVDRLAGAVNWPSAMHERALARARRRTHIGVDTSLLYDATSWNKLFRTDFWRGHGLHFAEQVLFEDVPAMLEAHCRASAVDVIGEVVYRWRRREDGIVSITQRRDEVLTLEHRVRSMAAIRELFARLAGPALSHAGEKKFLANDLGRYLDDLPATRPAFQNRFVELTRTFLRDSPAAVRSRLVPVQRTAYHLIECADADAVVEFLRFIHRNDGVLPLRRRGLSLHVDVGPASRVTPPDLTDVRRRLPVTMGVDAVGWSERHLELDGYGFLRGIPYDQPAAAVRRLKLVQRTTGRERHVWLAPVRHSGAAVRHGTHRHSYVWSGFRARVPLEVFTLPTTAASERWDVYLQVLGVGVAGGSSLGPPRSGSAWFPGIVHRPDGVVLSADWSSPHHLVVRAIRMRLRVAEAQVGPAGISCTLIPLIPGADHPLAVALALPGEAAPQPVPLDWRCRPDHRDCRAQVIMDAAPLETLRGDRPYVGCRLTEIGPDPYPVCFSGAEVSGSGTDSTLVIRADSAGRTEIIALTSRVTVDFVRWNGRRLVFEGRCSGGGTVGPGLALRSGTGDTLHSRERCDGDRFTAAFDLLDVPGPEGPHPVASGTWQLVQPGGPVQWQPVVAARGRQAAIEAVAAPEGVMVRLWVNRHAEVTVQAYANVEAVRGATAQSRLRRRVYAVAQRAAIQDFVLVECWQGKQYSDNPRALIETATAAGLGSPVAVAVRDDAVVTPPGLRRVVRWSREYYEALGRARLIIANDLLTRHYRKRSGQLLLQTWHGTPLKRIGFDIERIHFRNKGYLDDLRAETGSWDWLLSPNPHSTPILRTAFDYAGPILETGYPRNDLLAGSDAAERDRRRHRARTWFGADPETTVVLWMPTFRDDVHLPGGGYSAPVALDLDALDGLPRNTSIWLRGHHLMDRAFARLGDRGERLRIASGYPDVRDLLLAADLLVTDYSSVMFDFALTGKPMVFFVPDLEHYRDDIRGFYLDPAAVMPGPLVRTVPELVEAMRDRSGLDHAYTAPYAAFRRRFTGLEDGRAGERVWAVIRHLL